MGSDLKRGAQARVQAIDRSGACRLALTWAVLIAFALQSFVTQSHVHRAPTALVDSSVAAAIATAPTIGAPAPVDHEAIACPFCQAIAFAGAFVGPAPIALSWPVARAIVAVVPPVVIGLTSRAAGFSWRSRAPPQS